MNEKKRTNCYAYLVIWSYPLRFNFTSKLCSQEMLAQLKLQSAKTRNFLLLTFAQPECLTLTCDGGIRSGLLLAPTWDKHGNAGVTSVKEEIHCQLDASAGEHFLIAMTGKKQEKEKKKAYKLL